MQLRGPQVDIYLDRLADNLSYIQSLCSPARVLAVVKANAYGHGAGPVSQTLAECGVDGFCAALPSEIRELLDAGIRKPILHLGRIGKSVVELCNGFPVICTVNTVDDIDFLVHHMPRFGKISVHLKIDTGMGRMGCTPETLPAVIRKLKNTPAVRLTGVWSHFATAEEEDRHFMDLQLSLFKRLADEICDAVPECVSRHIANSAAVLTNPESHLDFIRPGIALYGVSPLGKPHPELKPVMEFGAYVSLVRYVTAGRSVGYNRTHTVSKETQIAVIQAGYADGVPMAFSNQGYVLGGNQLFPIIGKVSMDMITVDLKDTSNPPEKVLLWGGSEEDLRIENLAGKFNMLPYLFLTGISHRVSRIYHGH